MSKPKTKIKDLIGTDSTSTPEGVYKVNHTVADEMKIDDPLCALDINEMVAAEYFRHERQTTGVSFGTTNAQYDLLRDDRKLVDVNYMGYDEEKRSFVYSAKLSKKGERELNKGITAYNEINGEAAWQNRPGVMAVRMNENLEEIHGKTAFFAEVVASGNQADESFVSDIPAWKNLMDVARLNLTGEVKMDEAAPVSVTGKLLDLHDQTSTIRKTVVDLMRGVDKMGYRVAKAPPALVAADTAIREVAETMDNIVIVDPVRRLGTNVRGRVAPKSNTGRGDRSE